MFKTLLARARQGYRTASYPAEDPVLPALFRGRPEIDPARCITGCRDCVAACPTGALTVEKPGRLRHWPLHLLRRMRRRLSDRRDLLHPRLAACRLAAR